MMSTFVECQNLVKGMASYKTGKTFDGIDFFTLELAQPVHFKAQTSTLITVSNDDTNAEYEYIYKILKKL